MAMLQGFIKQEFIKLTRTISKKSSMRGSMNVRKEASSRCNSNYPEVEELRKTPQQQTNGCKTLVCFYTLGEEADLRHNCYNVNFVDIHMSSRIAKNFVGNCH